MVRSFVPFCLSKAGAPSLPVHFSCSLFHTVSEHSIKTVTTLDVLNVNPRIDTLENTTQSTHHVLREKIEARDAANECCDVCAALPLVGGS